MTDEEASAPQGPNASQAVKSGLLKRLLRLVAFLVVLALVIGAAATWYAQRLYVQAGPSQTDTIVWLPKGEGVNRIAARLAAAQVISEPLLFRIAVRLHGAESGLKAGEYQIPAHASMAEIIHLLREGKALVHKFTAAEGLTSEQIVALIATDPVLAGPTPAIPAEGSLLPETYNFTRGTTRAELIERMTKAQAKLLEELWSNRQEGLPLRTPQEAVTLASIVEKETGIPAERPRVAAVFVNRLRKSMRLQSDPTIIYGLVGGKGSLDHPIRRSELDRITPYNTYQIDGLPPTPICNPGEAALRAVLNPPASNDLYFVADGTGGHAFSATLAGHEANVKQWRRIEQGQSQKPASAK